MSSTRLIGLRLPSLLAGLLAVALPTGCGQPPEVTEDGADAVHHALGDESGVAAAARPSGWTPDKLNTGVDLSDVRFPVSTPQAGTRPGANPIFGQTPGQLPGQTGQSPAVPDGPVGKIGWEEGGDAHDFGEVVQGDVMDHVFEIYNEGEGDLVIHQIRPSCGCTIANTVVLAEDGSKSPYTLGTPVAPGTRMQIEAELNTTGKRQQVPTTVNVYCNDPRQVVPLKLSAFVKPMLQVDPSHLNFPKMTTADTVEGTLVVTSGVVDVFALTLNEEILPEAIRAELVPIEPDAEGRAAKWEVRVAVGPGATKGMLNSQLVLTSDIPMPDNATAHAGHDHAVQAPQNGSGPQTHRLMAHVIASVSGLVAADPHYVSLGLVRPGQVITRTVRIQCHDPEFELSEPKVSVHGFGGEPFQYADAITTTVRPVPDMNAYDVEVTLDGLPEELSTSFSGVLRFEVGHPTEPTLDVSFSGVCRPVIEAPVLPPVQQPQPAPAAGEGTPGGR